MVTYDFYVNTFLGSRIPEKAFPHFARQAQAYLDRLCRICRVEGGEEAKAMALCAMAEVLSRDRGDVVSASAGEMTVRYGGQSLLGRLYTQACVYLDIYRGKE